MLRQSDTCALLVAPLLLAGCIFAPRIGEGTVGCGVNAACPPGFVCANDQKCYSLGSPLDAGVLDGGDPGCLVACASNNCGTMSDRCGEMIRCTATCPASAPICGGGGANLCGTQACTRMTACPSSLQCGFVSDGCAGVNSCGTCAGTAVCAGDGTPNTCCTPLTACPAGANCGMAPDGCGGKVDCGGPCAMGMCGGGGTPNVCGPRGQSCTPRTCAGQSKNCGSISNGCNAVIRSCGTCIQGQVCRANVCSPS
jgi:hypothetical protein